MATDGPSDYGTLVIAALLILSLGFSGAWIFTYVEPGQNPWVLLPWFGLAGIAILVLGLVMYLGRGRTGRNR
jgi:hypothetical protein